MLVGTPGTNPTVTTITSRRHEFVQQCRTLARERIPGSDLVLLDGLHLVGEALSAGITIERAAIAPKLRTSPGGDELVRRLVRQGVEVAEASEGTLEAMSPVRSPAGIVAVARVPPASLKRAVEGSRPLVIVAVDVQDPGNLGAIVRVVEAGFATGVICAGASADPFGWKALRGSMGSTFRVPVTDRMPLADAIDALRKGGLRISATVPRDGTSVFEADMTVPLAVLVGSEGGGLDPGAIEQSDMRLVVPMNAPVESLNVAAATAVIVFEAHRQRVAAGSTGPRVTHQP